MKKRLKILFIPAWYPSELNPVDGVFVREHAKAASLYNDISVLHIYQDPNPQLIKLYNTSDSIEYGLRTIRFRYGGPLLLLWQKFKQTKSKIFGYNNVTTSKRSLFGELLMGPVHIVGLLLLILSSMLAFHRLLKTGYKPDVIHAHVFTVGVPAILLGKLYRIPIIITEHYTKIAEHTLNLWERRKIQFALGNADIVLPVSNDLVSAIKDYYRVKCRTIVVPNTINTGIFYPENHTKRTPEPYQKRMLTVCVLTPRKGIPYLLEALSQVKCSRQDFVLDIVGDGPNRNEYEMLSRKLELDRIVQFSGQQPEVASFMRKCDFFVLPSQYENFGVVYIEAMACGKPVIATDAGGPKEIVDKEVGILVPYKNIKALRQSIEYMLDNYQNYSPQKISQYAKERFSHQVVGALLNQVYQQVTEK